MPKQIPKQELDAIIDIVSKFSEGISLGKIMETLQASYTKGLENLKHPVSHRNVQYRLAFLVKKGLLHIEGKARARLYKLPLTMKKGMQDDVQAHPQLHKNKNYIDYADYEIPLSQEGAAINNHVGQPIQARTPISYNMEFLDEYRPNVTYYLSESIRQRLFEIGKTNDEQPAGTYARKILGRLLIDLSWNSSRLEGNTYSLLETERLFAFSQNAEGKDLRETQMILNHKGAIEFLIETASEIGINCAIIRNLHALLSNDLMTDLEACGRLRSIPVAIGKSVYQPLSMPHQIQELFEQVVDTARAIKNPFEQSFFLMVHLPYLQPFEDVNKRVSRLAANIPFIRDNLCPLSFIDVPQQTYINGLLGVYELNRIELLRDVFVWAYERSCLRYSATRKELGEPDPFRMKYRNAISENVVRVVRGRMDKAEAIASIREYTHAHVSIPSEDQERFIEAVERDIMSLHEGNIARHRIRDSEYEAWKKNWR